MPRYHHIGIGEKSTTCINLTQAGGRLSIAFMTSARPHQDRNCPAFQNVHDIPLSPPFDPALDGIQAGQAVKWVMELDEMTRQAFDRGSMCRKDVQASNPETEAKDQRLSARTRESRRSVGELIRPILLPIPDLSELRNFQREGVLWLLQNPRAILADDMGLGKTAEALSALRMLFNQGKAKSSLVICPRSLLANWEAELRRWAPELSSLIMSPSGQFKEEAWQEALGRTHVIMTNYEQLLSITGFLSQFKFDVLIADEAHRIRNLSARITKSIRQIDASIFWALTGTPIERDAGDLLTLLSTLAPFQFSTHGKASMSPDALRARARPFVLRRMKKDVLAELPELLEVHQTLDLLPSQRKSYQALSQQLKTSPNTEILAKLNELRTICDYDQNSGESSKAVRITEIIESIAQKGEKVVVFSFLLRPLDILKSMLDQEIGPDRVVELRGDQTQEVRLKSLESFKNEDNKCVLLGSSRVAGEGLTLTAANHVLFFNRWWNPSSNAQARDRVLRIGQEREVTMYTFTCANTIETTIEDILRSKDGITLDVIDRLAQVQNYDDKSTSQFVEELSKAIIASENG